MSDLKDELERERREKEWAETWKPSGPGDMLIGTLEGYDEDETAAGGNDRAPKESSGDAPDFDGSDLYGPPATDTAGSGGAPQPPEGEGGESTLDDPNAELPF